MKGHKKNSSLRSLPFAFKVGVLFMVTQGVFFFLLFPSSPTPIPPREHVARSRHGKKEHGAPKEKPWQLKFYKRQTRALHLLLQSQLTDRPATPRTIVVSKNIKTDDEILAWAKGFGIPVEIVDSEHKLHATAEAVAWLKYIVQNYETMPEHVVFLTDSGPDWHSRPDWTRRIMVAAPACREGENKGEEKRREEKRREEKRREEKRREERRESMRDRTQEQCKRFRRWCFCSRN